MINTMTTWQELEAEADNIGFLPYFSNKIPGFSVEENVPKDILWDTNSGPWDWKGSVTRNLKVAYGKFFNGKAGYISVDWLADFINVRRYHYFAEPNTLEAELLAAIQENGVISSKELKKLAGITSTPKGQKSANPFENQPVIKAKKSAKKSKWTPKKFSKKPIERTESQFDKAMTRLQMGGYVVIADFEYLYDKKGEKYGWGIACYSTPQHLYGIDIAHRPDDESFCDIFQQLRRFLPDIDGYLIAKLIS